MVENIPLPAGQMKVGNFVLKGNIVTPGLLEQIR